MIIETRQMSAIELTWPEQQLSNQNLSASKKIAIDNVDTHNVVIMDKNVVKWTMLSLQSFVSIIYN